MNARGFYQTSRLETWLRIILVLLTVLSFFGFVQLVRAEGAAQISGVGRFADEGECTDDVVSSKGKPPDFAQVLTGDLEGCIYVFVDDYVCNPGGVGMERGEEIFVGRYRGGEMGTFRTNYLFTAKFGVDCANYAGQLFGRCQHPIIEGSGTGGFAEVRGRLDFKDDVDAGVANYRGHLQF